MKTKINLNQGDTIDISEPYPWDGLLVWQVMNDKCLASFGDVEMVVVSIDDIDGWCSACKTYKAHKNSDSEWSVCIYGGKGIEIDCASFSQALQAIEDMVNE